MPPHMIDTNHHVNNSQYIRLALDCIPQINTAKIREIRVEYKKPAVLGGMVFPHLQDEAGSQTALYRAIRVAYQLTAVRAGKHDAVGLDVDIDAVHHEAYLVVGRSKQATVDAIEQDAGRHLDACGILAHRLCHRIGSSIHRHNSEGTGAVDNLHLLCVGVVADAEGLLGQFFHRLHDGLCRDAEAGVAVLLHRGNGRDEVFLAVGCRDGDCPAVHVEEETIQNGH